MHFVQLTAEGGGTPFHELEAQIRCIESPDIKKNEDLEDENRRPKQMLADLSLEPPRESWRLNSLIKR
ncbi:hypothetical protein GTJ90_28930 [Escherichia coli]|nr:hypothetical protein [Escherichia coli]